MSAMSPEREPGGSEDAATRTGFERLLVFIVAFLGLLILAGLGAVLFKILSLSTTPSTSSGAAATSEMARGPEAVAQVAIPQGAVVKSVSLSGDRIAIHYEAAGTTGIAVVDLTSGAVLSRLTVAPSSP